MKVVNLCGKCGKCPVVKIYEDSVEIGEEGNLCTLTKEEWESLRSKILDSEL